MELTARIHIIISMSLQLERVDHLLHVCVDGSLYATWPASATSSVCSVVRHQWRQLLLSPGETLGGRRNVVHTLVEVRG